MQAPVAFPSLGWFERLVALMREHRPLYEKLGYVDCKVRFTVLDGGPGGTPWSVRIHFDAFDVLEVKELGAASDKAADADFSIAATLETWRKMIQSISEGGGKPALQQTLNDLNLRSRTLLVDSNDLLTRDLFFRYNQSLQTFINASGALSTVFPEAR